MQPSIVVGSVFLPAPVWSFFTFCTLAAFSSSICVSVLSPGEGKRERDSPCRSAEGRRGLAEGEGIQNQRGGGEQA